MSREINVPPTLTSDSIFEFNINEPFSPMNTNELSSTNINESLSPLNTNESLSPLNTNESLSPLNTSGSLFRNNYFKSYQKKKTISKSWDDRREKNTLVTPTLITPTTVTFASSYSAHSAYSTFNNSLIPEPKNDFFQIPRRYNKYDPINNCKSAGVIPYTIINNTVYFLFQCADNPIRKKDSGWNDFGGKRIDPNDTTAETAAREFSEETSCLFYFKYQNTVEAESNYHLLKDNKNLFYDKDAVDILKTNIPLSQKFFTEKIIEFVAPIYLSSKETYISYFIYVPYIPESDIPRAEDIHIPYEDRYLRRCKWFSYHELSMTNEKDFHKRLQITKIQQRINNYYKKGLFT